MVGDVALAAHSCVLPAGAVTTDATTRTAGWFNQSQRYDAVAVETAIDDGAVVSVGQIIWTTNRIQFTP